MRKTSIYRRIAFIAALALLLVLIGFQLLPLAYNESSIISQADLQATRAQRIAKDALILAYRPVNEHAQAISELQNSLPVWEHEQAYLQQNARNPDIQTILGQAQPDYQAIDTAGRQLLAHPTDQTQTVIIMQHERNYSLLMNQVSSLVQDRIQSATVELVTFQVAIAMVVMILAVIIFVLAPQAKPPTQKEEEHT